MAYNNYKKKCRICLNSFSQFSQLKPITTKTYDDVTYEELIIILSGDEVEKLSENIKYPKHICLICEKGILFAYKFKNKLIKANSKLKYVNLNENKSKTGRPIISLYNNKCYRHSNDSYSKTSNESFYTANTDNVENSNNSLLNKKRISRNLQIKYKICKKNFNSCEENKKNFGEKNAKKILIYKASGGTCSTLERPRPYTCGICHRTFALKSNLSYHIHSHRKKQTLIKCNHCGKEFKHWILRRKHIFLEHNPKSTSTGDISDKNLNIDNMKT